MRYFLALLVFVAGCAGDPADDVQSLPDAAVAPKLDFSVSAQPDLTQLPDASTLPDMSGCGPNGIQCLDLSQQPDLLPDFSHIQSPQDFSGPDLTACYDNGVACISDDQCCHNYKGACSNQGQGNECFCRSKGILCNGLSASCCSGVCLQGVCQ